MMLLLRVSEGFSLTPLTHNSEKYEGVLQIQINIVIGRKCGQPSFTSFIPQKTNV